MKKKSKGHSNAGKKKPQLSPDEVTRNKIDKHLSDEEIEELEKKAGQQNSLLPA